jgi:hypothetical protein
VFVLFDGLVQLLVGGFDRGQELGEGPLGEEGEHFNPICFWEGGGNRERVVVRCQVLRGGNGASSEL